MILVDSSVWIDFFNEKRSTKALSELLTENRVTMHPWVIAELRLGNLGMTDPDHSMGQTELTNLRSAWELKMRL